MLEFSDSDASISQFPSSSPPRHHQHQHQYMCRTKKDVLASDPKPRTPTAARRSSSNTNTNTNTIRRTSTRTTTSNSASLPTNTTTASASSSSSSGASSIAGLRLSLSHPTLYPFADISAVTNNFLSKRLSSSSSWRCSLRGKDVVVFQRPFRGDPANLPSRLSALCKSHHSSLVELLGASLSGENIYLVYEYVAGASLQECLRNPKNPNFTPLSKWISRMQVATDLAEGMEYIHHHCGTIHNRITSSSVIVTEPNFNAKICHFGASDLAGEIPVEEAKIVEEEEEEEERDEISAEITPSATASSRVLRRSDSRRMRIEGSRGYIAPEVIAGGRISHRSDVYAFGVVILELISGRERLKYTMTRETNDYERVSLIETAREAIGTEDEDGASEAEAEERRARIRWWVDRRLRDSFPVGAAEELIRVALRCVEEAPFMRPEMTWVAGRVSKLFLDSQAWEERVRTPTQISVSLAPR